MARARRLPRRRARLPVPALRLLVPGRGPPRPVRGLRSARGPDEGGDRLRRGRARALVRGGSRTTPNGAHDRRRRNRLLAPRDPRRSPRLRGRRVRLLSTLRGGRGLAGRHRRDRSHRPAPAPSCRLRRNGCRLSAPACGAVRARRAGARGPPAGAAGAGDQPALVHADTDIDPLPLHGCDHAGSGGCEHLRGGEARKAPAGRAGAARGAHARALPGRRVAPRPQPALVARPR